MPRFFGGTGDDGYTDLLGNRRVPKSHLKPAAYGAVDEASAALGLAKALTDSEAIKLVIEEAQRDLYSIMSEVAAEPEVAERFRVVGPERVSWLETQVEQFGDEVQMPKGFVISGDTPASAALDLARTAVRRAERAVVQLALEDEVTFSVKDTHSLVYLNRLSSLCFLLALWEIDRAGGTPTMAKA